MKKALIKLPQSLIRALKTKSDEKSKTILSANGQWVDVVQHKGVFKTLCYKGVEFEVHTKLVAKMVNL